MVGSVHVTSKRTADVDLDGEVLPWRHEGPGAHDPPGCAGHPIEVVDRRREVDDDDTGNDLLRGVESTLCARVVGDAGASGGPGSGCRSGRISPSR